ncbi:MAG: porin family protein [Bacteroidota bacterium]
MRLLLMGFVLLYATLLSAQRATDFEPELEVGFGVGSWSSEVDFPDALNVSQEPINGINLGLSLRYFDRKSVGFMAEINYDQAGWLETQDSLDESYRRSIDFLTTQLFTQLSFGRGLIRPVLQGGCYVSFPIADQEEIPDEFFVQEFERSYYRQSYSGRITYGLVFGGGVYLHFGPLSFQLEGRFLAGFSDLFRPGETQAETSRRRSAGFRVTSFYRIK